MGSWYDPNAQQNMWEAQHKRQWIETKVHEAITINMTATEYMHFFRYEYDVDWMVSDMYWSGGRSYAFVHNENNHLAGAGSHHGFPKRFKNYCHYHRYEPFYNYFQTQKANLWNMIYYGPFIGPLVQGIVGWLVSLLGSDIVNWLVDYLLGQVMGLISKMMASFCTVYCEGEGCELQDYGRDYLSNVMSFKGLSIFPISLVFPPRKFSPSLKKVNVTTTSQNSST